MFLRLDDDRTHATRNRNHTRRRNDGPDRIVSRKSGADGIAPDNASADRFERTDSAFQLDPEARFVCDRDCWCERNPQSVDRTDAVGRTFEYHLR